MNYYVKLLKYNKKLKKQIGASSIEKSILPETMNVNTYVQSLVDSVTTSVNGVKLFSSLEIASYHHIFKSRYILFPIEKCRNLENFNSDIRLSDDPYPVNNRPRGNADIESVAHHIVKIKNSGYTDPIFIACKNKEYILLDGAHRIVAYYLEKREMIPAFIIDID